MLSSRSEATSPLRVWYPARYISMVFASLEGGTGKLLLVQILSCQRERCAYDCTSQWYSRFSKVIPKSFDPSQCYITSESEVLGNVHLNGIRNP
jgi:hypothetical protein